jgi:hypothetical protein
MTQKQLATLAEMAQPRISAMERPGATKFNIETLVRLASAFKVGLKVEFVPFHEMLAWENGFSQDRFDVTQIDNDALFLNPAPVEVRQVLTVANCSQYNEKQIVGEDLWSEVINIPLAENVSMSIHSPTANFTINTSQLLNDEWSQYRWQNAIKPIPQTSQSLMLTRSV